MLSDTRTNAGFDNIASFRKMFVFEAPGERVIAILTAGNLSVTQTVIAKLAARDRAPEDPETSIMLRRDMLEVAEIVGRTLNEVYVDVDKRMERSDASASASMLLGGQRLGGQLRLFLIYREGNFIEATDDTPYLQIGEHKYGKPILDRVVRPSTSARGRAQGGADLDGLDTALQPVGGDAARPAHRPPQRVSRHDARAHRGRRPDLRRDVGSLEPGPARRVRQPAVTRLAAASADGTQAPTGFATASRAGVRATPISAIVAHSRRAHGDPLAFILA